MKIAVASGKGGTGKTTVSVNLAVSLLKYLDKELQLIDCDIEEPNDLMFFNLEPFETIKSGIKIPVIDGNKCTYCGICAEVCEFNAIAILKSSKKFYIAEDLCHGCGACSYFCPVNAISEKDNYIGKINKYKKDKLIIIEGKLNISESMPSPVLRDTLSQMDDKILSVLDAPPGTSCSMVETVSEVDYVILVTEPTPFGLNDLKLAVDVVRKLNKKFGVVINKANLGDDEIYDYLKSENIEILMEIPFNEEIARVYSEGGIIVEKISGYMEKFIELYKKIEKSIKE